MYFLHIYHFRNHNLTYDILRSNHVCSKLSGIACSFLCWISKHSCTYATTDTVDANRKKSRKSSNFQRSPPSILVSMDMCFTSFQTVANNVGYQKQQDIEISLPTFIMSGCFPWGKKKSNKNSNSSKSKPRAYSISKMPVLKDIEILRVLGTGIVWLWNMTQYTCSGALLFAISYTHNNDRWLRASISWRLVWYKGIWNNSN